VAGMIWWRQYRWWVEEDKLEGVDTGGGQEWRWRRWLGDSGGHSVELIVGGRLGASSFRRRISGDEEHGTQPWRGSGRQAIAVASSSGLRRQARGRRR
jgi:hypothetical protein